MPSPTNFAAVTTALALVFTLASGGRSQAQNADLPQLPNQIVIAEKLAGKLVRLEGGEFVEHALDPEVAIDFFLLYYSGGWNPGCAKFTPALVKFYEEQKAAGANFEIILVSKDDSEADMKKHMADTKMPWPAVRFTDIEGLEFAADSAGRGVPCLAALDSRGLILVHSYKGRKEYLGAEKPLKEFAKILAAAAAKRAERDKAAGEKPE